jgi:2-polyprenyl-6-methoxyphenol hydroxylase-like FAD-dependent oxidoreductase
MAVNPARTAPSTSGASVLIVGAGPVGLVAACELAGRGVRVRIIDRLPAPTEQSRAIVVHARTLEMFERMGVVDDVLASGIKTVAMQMFASGRRVAKIDFDHVDSAYPYSLTTPQTETERILGIRLAALGGGVERGVELTHLTQDDDQVHLTLQNVDGTTEEATATYVVGADGSHSTVRDQIGVHLAGSFKGERFILGDVDAEHDLDPSSFHTFFAADGPLMVFPMLGRRARIMAQINAPAGQPLSATVSQSHLQQLVDERSDGITIRRSHWLTEFEIHHAQVPSYRVGRVFLAGDAAHVHSPAGGQGMNTGMQDAFNLAWKLALAVREPVGPGVDALLDSYHQERHPVAAKVIDFSTRLTAIGTVRGDLAIALRDHAVQLAVALSPVRQAVATQLEEVSLAYRKSPIVVPSRHRGGAVHAGDHLPVMPDVAVQRRLDAAITASPGHVLITVAPAAAALPPALPAAGPGWRHVLVSDTGEAPDGYDVAIADPDRVVAQRLGLPRGGRVALRPDGYVGCLDTLDAFAIDPYLRLMGN